MVGLFPPVCGAETTTVPLTCCLEWASSYRGGENRFVSRIVTSLNLPANGGKFRGAGGHMEMLSHGRLLDHYALSVANLDAWITKLRREREIFDEALQTRQPTRRDDRRAQPRSH